jgi:periplasmic protein TonB
MEPQEKLTTQQFVIDRLHDIQRKAEANNFADALATIKEVKAADAKNIYLIAIEKQIAKLGDSSLPEESRNGIVKSLPAMIDRALTDIQRRFAAAPKVDESQKEQKEAALEKLKSQYFQRADDYVEKHEYQRALEEIRRIYIIEPGSVVAKEYEQKIEQLAALHARSEAQAAAAEEAKERKVEVRAQKKPEVVEPKKSVPVVEPPKEIVAQHTEEEPKKSKVPILIAAAALLVLVIGAWFIFGRGSKSTQSNQEQAQQPARSQDSIPPTTSPATSPPAQSVKESAPLAETSKKLTKAEKKLADAKAAAQNQKAVQPAVTPPSKTQSKQQVNQTPPAASQQPVQQQPSTTESGPAPMPFVAIENPPEIIRREPAKYPDIAIKMGIQGKVVIEVTVDAQGKPIQTKILQTTSDVFNDAAIEAVMKYTYKPAMQSNSPVTAKLVIPIKFNLQK